MSLRGLESLDTLKEMQRVKEALRIGQNWSLI